MMLLKKIHNNGIKTVLKSSTMMVLKLFYNIKTVLKRSTMMVLRSLKRFHNDGTKKVPHDGTKKVP